MSITLEAYIHALNQQRDDPRNLFYDVQHLVQLTTDERTQAENTLLDWATQGDFKAIEALVAVPLQRALPLLESLRGKGDSWSRAAVLRTLARVRGERSDVEALRDVLNTQDPLERTLSAYQLKHSDQPELVLLLLDLMNDPTPSVRVHAQEGLLAHLQLQALDEPRQAPLRWMQLAGMSSLPTLWPTAQQRLSSVFEAKLGGASAEELDLVYQPSADPGLPDQLWQTIRSQTDPLPLERLPELSPHDRAWLETVMLSRLESCDARSPMALVALGTPRLAAHLQQARALADGRERLFIQECDRVLGTIA